MELENVEEVLESLFFVSGNGLKVSEVADLLEVQKPEINKAIKKLKEKYSGKNGIHLIEYNGKVQFSSNPAYADAVAKVLNPIKEKELSSATLETVAIIAYKQPVTKIEIEKIRGVNSDRSVNKLVELELVKEVGRLDAPGRPMLFGTTEEFLRTFGVGSIDELPVISEDLVEQFKDEAEMELEAGQREAESVETINMTV